MKLLQIHEHNQHNDVTELFVSFTTECHTLIVDVSPANEWSIPTLRLAYCLYVTVRVSLHVPSFVNGT